MESQLRSGALALLLALPMPAAHAEMLNDHDSGPLSALFGLPDSSEAARLLPRGGLRWSTVASAASHSIIEAGGGERIALDGETRRVAGNLRFGMTDRIEIGIEVPYVWHESGSLDTLIEGWHDAFGLPNGARSQQPGDNLELRYSDNGIDRVNLVRNVNGPGDVRLIGGIRLGSGEQRYALRIGVKLPTGDSDTLLGSGGTDLSLGIAGEYDDWLGLGGLSTFFYASVVRLGEPDLLADRYREFVSQLAFGAGYPVSERIELRAQLRLRSAIYDSNLVNLGEPAAALTFGGNIRLGNRWRLSLAVAEDIKVHSAPDVTFQLGLHFRNDR